MRNERNHITFQYAVESFWSAIRVYDQMSKLQDSNARITEPFPKL